MKKYDVVALGELLIDFTESGVSNQGNPCYEANPGGAPCNVLAMLRKLEKNCAFIGKVGNDGFGQQLRKVAESTGIDLRGLCMDDEVHTTLAVVHKLANGDRDFSFYRKPGADTMLRWEEVDTGLLSSCRIFHFGTLSLTDEPCRTSTINAVTAAKAAGAMISFDPNLRPPLWDSLEHARREIAWGLAQSDIVKISDNEIEFMTGVTDYDCAAAMLMESYPNIRLLCVTAGAFGSYAWCQGVHTFQPAYNLGSVIETTGAGDTFCACMLNHVLEHGLEAADKDDLQDMLRFANAAAYLVTTKKGAICSMPERAHVEAILQR